MSKSFKNISGRPISIVLNSRTTLHMPPGHEETLADAEVEGNAKFEKLLKLKLISEPSKPAPKPKRSKRPKRKS